MESSTFSVTDAFPDGRCRLILIGKTGAGKSATGNTIVGGEVFKSRTGLNAETKQCGLAIGVRNGLEILVMDTPGLCDTDGDDEVIAERITQSLFAVAPGPHAILLVIRSDSRFTEEELKAIQMLKDIFGTSMTSYLIPIFVRKDQLEGLDFHTELQKSKAKSVVEEANNRYILFDNKACAEERGKQVDQLLQLVCRVFRETNGRYYRHKISSELDEAMSEMVREELRKRGKESILEIRKNDVRKKLETQKETRSKTTIELCKQQPLSRNVDKDQDKEQTEETEDDETSLAKREVQTRKKEMTDLKQAGTVREKLGVFQKRVSGGSVDKEELSSPGFPRRKLRPSLDGPFQMTPKEAPHGHCKHNIPTATVESEDNKADSVSVEMSVTNTGNSSEEGCKMEAQREPLDPEESTAHVAISDNLGQKTADTGVGDTTENPTDTGTGDTTQDPTDTGTGDTKVDSVKTESTDSAWDWSSDQDKLEEALDQLEEEIREELTSRNSHFFYELPDKSTMNLHDKRMLVEDTLRRKIVSDTEQLNDNQKKHMDGMVRSVSRKLRGGMSKFAVKTVEQCLLM